MAQINLSKIKRIDKNRNTIHEKVYATFTIFEMNETKYFQLDTYGRFERENPEKISQSIQIDRDVAKYLVNILMQEFGLK